MFFIRTLLLVCCLAALSLAQGRAADNNSDNSYAPTELKEISNHAVEFEGRRVAVTAEIISVSADRKGLVVFDNNTKTLANVSLVQLAKSQRHSLIADPVHRVSVFGRVEIKNGRAVIKAEQVMPLSTNLVASE
ncbi:MAG: hypothetical protein JST85_05080 [Acidobacteria bacterium]|nr:hypothetical protein [Acidobacteriota bacterium]